MSESSDGQIDILELPPAELTRFVQALAEGQAWAVAATASRIGDEPFDFLATYWSVAPRVARAAIAAGLLRHLAEIPAQPRRLLQLGGEGPRVDEVLGFCAGVIAELDSDLVREFIPHLRRWLDGTEVSAARLAATALASIATEEAGEALGILEAAATRLHYPQWLLPSLLERRSKTNYLGLFLGAETWLSPMLSSSIGRASLQDAFERIAANESAGLVHLLSGLLTTVSSAAAAEVRALVSDIPIGALTSFQPIIADRFRANPPLVTAAVDYIHRLCEYGAQTDQLTHEWSRILNDLAYNDSREWLWNFVREYAAGRFDPSQDNRFLQSLRRALFDLYPLALHEAPSHLFAELQRQYLGHALSREAPLIEVQRKKVLDELAPRVRSRSGVGSLPEKIRIPSVYYAEEAYVEILRLLIEAHFPNVEVHPVANQAWDHLALLFERNDVDVALNNDDFLSHHDAARDLKVYRLGGKPLYHIDAFPLLARLSFVQKHAPELLSMHHAGKITLTDSLTPEAKDAVICRLLAAGPVAVPRKTELETALTNFLAERNLARAPGPWPGEADEGLRNLLDHDVNLYFSGRLQASFALKASSDIVVVANNPAPLDGRLFARRQYVEAYPEFMESVARLCDEIQLALHPLKRADYLKALASVLTHRMNSVLLHGEKAGIATIDSMEHLHEVLSDSRLQTDPQRLWEPWSERTYAKHTQSDPPDPN